MKNISKRILPLVLTLALMLSYSACGGDKIVQDIVIDSGQPAPAEEETASDDALDWLSWGLFECFIDDQWGGTLYSTLSFTGNGEVEFNAGGLNDFEGPENSYYEIYEMYQGTYEVVIESSGEMTSGTMSFDLGLTWWIAELGEDPSDEDLAYWDERQKIVGTYSFEAGDGMLDLKLTGGQALMHMGWPGTPIETYSFWQTSFDGGYEDVFYGTSWSAILEPGDMAPAIEGHLRFGYDGSAAYDFGTGYSPAGMGMVMYRGGFYVNEADGVEEGAFVINLYLTLDSAEFSDDPGIPHTIDGYYIFTVTDGRILTLSLIGGDPLYSDWDGRGIDEYDFYYNEEEPAGFNPWALSDSELLDYCIMNSGQNPDFFRAGMLYYAVGGTTDLPGEGICRDIWIGLAEEEGIILWEMLYTVGSSGAVYDFDYEDETWGPVAVG